MRTRVDSAAPRRAATTRSSPAADAPLGSAGAEDRGVRNADGSRCHDDVFGDRCSRAKRAEIRAVALWLCGAVSSSRFPGSQPVSWRAITWRSSSAREYRVTWKADGTRYLLLLMRDGLT